MWFWFRKWVLLAVKVLGGFLVHGPYESCFCCFVSMVVVFRFFLAFLSFLDDLRVGAADGKMNGGKFLSLLHRGDIPVIEASPVAWAGRCTGILVIERVGQVCQDTILERKGPGPMPLSSVAPLNNGVVAGLNG